MSSAARDAEISELFRSEYARLVRALSLAAGSRDAAAEVVQEAFVQAYRHWRKVRVYEDPAGWVRRVAVNRLANRSRQRRRFERAMHRLSSGELVQHRPDGDNRVDVVRALLGLPEGQRTAVCLR